MPSTGGTFVITLLCRRGEEVVETVVWDRKAEGGFPETKELKRRVRDVVEPGRGLGHVDRHSGGKEKSGGTEKVEGKQGESRDAEKIVGEIDKKCEEC